MKLTLYLLSTSADSCRSSSGASCNGTEYSICGGRRTLSARQKDNNYNAPPLSDDPSRKKHTHELHMRGSKRRDTKTGHRESGAQTSGCLGGGWNVRRFSYRSTKSLPPNVACINSHNSKV